MKLHLSEIIQKSAALPLPVNSNPYRPMTVEELNATMILTRHAANVLVDLMTEHNFVLTEIAIASVETDVAKLAIMNELIRRSAGFTAMKRAETVEVEP